MSFGKYLGINILLLSLFGCNKDTVDTSTIIAEEQKVISNGLSIPNNRDVDSYHVLFIGNSHVGSNDLSDIVSQLIEINTDKTSSTALSSSQKFLSERIGDDFTEDDILAERWTHIILQAQKYSQSNSIDYPTTGAEHWARLSKSQGATPILFPEHPQKGNRGEGQYVYNIHKRISENEAACIAPIGPAWDLALAINEQLPLHSPDGNHAALTGTFLSALVFYQVITGESAEDLPFMSSIAIPEDTQRLLREVTNDVIGTYGDCNF